MGDESGTADTTSAGTAGTYSYGDVLAALNNAADDILEATDAGDEGLRDALNLMVNASAHYLTRKADSLEQVVTDNYEEGTYADVLDWIRRGMRM